MADETTKRESEELERLLVDWRWKVRDVTFALLVASMGLVVAPLALFGVLLPFGQTLAAAIIAGGIGTIAGPIAWWVARAAVPVGLPAVDPDKLTKSIDGDEVTLEQARDVLVAEALKEVVHHTGIGEGLKRWAWTCVVVTKVGPAGALFATLAAVALGIAAVAPVPGSFGMLFTGFALAIGALADAMRRPLPLLLDPVRPLEEPEKIEIVEEEERDASRPRGRDFLERLRASSLYRRQDVALAELKGRPIDYADGLLLLKARYPMFSRRLLARTGVKRLTSGQSRAVAEILAVEPSASGQGHQDFVFFGWSGSGRSTLCNLLTLAAMTHREGAVHCISPESPERGVTEVRGVPSSGGTRHPVAQLRGWLEEDDEERIQEAYADREHSHLTLTDGPDVVYTDVRLLAEEILGKATGDARDFIRRLKYVIIDHPNRLPREDLIRLRIALSRLRLTAELYGRELTFIVMLPRLDNFQQTAKWLLNNDGVAFVPFDGWFGPAMVLGWLPPHELVEGTRHTDVPLFARAKFSEEAIALLTELGVQAHDLRSAGQDPLRIAVIDSQPLLGPELRTQLGEVVLGRLKDKTPHTESLEVTQDWTYFGTHDLAVDRERRFDVCVCIGVGPHPEHLVASLRAAVADDGLVILMGDSSTTDHESIRTLREPGWDPMRAVEKVAYPSLVLPEHSQAVIAHELASLFGDFADSPVPRERLAGVFPGEHTNALVGGWIREGILFEMEAFEAPRADTAPERAPYLRQSASSPLSGGRYEVPWGCCSRHVFTIFDQASGNECRHAGPSLATYVDRDRLFIDFHVYARLRFPPNSVEVVDLREHQLGAREIERAKEHWVSHGQVVVTQVDYSAGITIDRRAARYQADLHFERPFPRPGLRPLSEHLHPEIDRNPLSGSLRSRSVDDPGETMLASAMLRGRAIVAESFRPSAPLGAGCAPLLSLVGGSWICVVEESLRDVVFTGPRLVEDHELISSVQLPVRLRAQMRRSLECTATSLSLQLTTEAHRALSQPPPGDGTIPAIDRALLADYPAHNALARTLRLYFARRFMDFDSEYRFTVLPSLPEPKRSLAFFPGPSTEPGPTGRYAGYEPEPVQALVHRILGRQRTERTPILDRVDDLCALFDWMHANIRYEKDDVLYDQKEYIASPQETLGNRAGDCEDHAILMGSMCQAIGMQARTLMLPDHALCEVYLGHKDDLDLEAIRDRIRAYQESVARRYQLGGLARPYIQGKLAEGWRRSGFDIEHDPKATPGSFGIGFDEVWFDIDEETGEVWIIADDCCVGAYLGDPAGLVAGEYLDTVKGWQKDHSFQHPVPRTSGWRILAYRLRQDELAPDQHLAPLLSRQLVDKVLDFVIERLERCDCDDGCAACCGGLGTIPLPVFTTREVAPEHFTEQDVISRAGAYRLACALAGRPPNWQVYGSKPTGVHPPGGEPPSAEELEQLVRSIIGTPPRYTSGPWSAMFRQNMVLDPDSVAQAVWMDQAEIDGNPDTAGFYQPSSNVVHILPGRPRPRTLQTIVHEYAHNWQFTGDFDLDRHYQSEEAKQYFDGNLVIEGHARWADHTYRFYRGMGSLYGTTDPEGWNEYKTGYFLMEGIYNAFGEAGLFRWLGKKPDVGEAPKSRDQRLTWPFTLREALQAFGLEEEALTGTFDGIDVVVEREREVSPGGGEGEPGSGGSVP